MTWPLLPAGSPNSFLDHFASLDATKWGTVTSGTGSVTVTDSYCDLNMPANSAAAIYYKTPIIITKSQLWLAAVSSQTLNVAGFAPRVMALVQRATAPVADTKANVDAETVIERYWPDATHLASGYYDNTHVGKRWSGATGSEAWVNGGTAVATDCDVIGQADDYYVVGLEIDAVNARWREMVWGQSFVTAGTYTFDQGWRLFALSDWVTWAATQDTSAGLWLTFGWLANNNTVANDVRVEWVRYTESVGNAVTDAFAAGMSPASGYHSIKHSYSYDGQLFLPQDRTTLTIDKGAAASWEEKEVQEPWAVFDGVSTDWIFYTGYTNAGVRAIGCASAVHASPQVSAFTKFGSNPVLTVGAAGQNDDNLVDFACVVCDLSEPNASKLFKMLYSGRKTADSKWRVLYATAPAATGPWTKQGTVLDVGAGGANDETAARDCVVVRYNGQWEMYYEGWDAAGLTSLMRATASDLGGPWTKQGTVLKPSANATDQALTANLSAAPGRTVTVTSTTGFQVDAMVVATNGNTATSWSASRVRKVVNPTTLELYHGLTGFTTLLNSRIKQMDSVPNLTPRYIAWNGSKWIFHLNFWEPWLHTAQSASFGSNVLEEGYVYSHTNAAPSGATPAPDYTYTPSISRGFAADSQSYENMTVIGAPFAGDAATFRELVGVGI